MSVSCSVSYVDKGDRAVSVVAGRLARSCLVSRKAAFLAGLVFLFATLLLPCVVLADNYEGGQPLTTVSSGIVSGGVYVDANPAPDWSSMNVTKTFSLPAAAVAVPGRIVWARLYVSVYCGHMQNNYATIARVTFDGNGDGVFETTLGTLPLTMDQGFNFIVNGGNPAPDGGLPWDVIDDHTTRVSSDYLMWYNVTGLLTGANPGVNVNTSGSFDGRIKVITLVVAYNDGSDNQYYYWVNQGHDVDSYYLDVPESDASEHNDYIGSTLFNGIPTGFTNASLTVNHMASSDGLYTFDNVSLPRYDDVSAGDSYVQGPYSGYDVWNVTGLINSDTGDLTYDRSAMGGTGEFSGQFYKIPLAVLTVQLPAGVPGANFSANLTRGIAPLTVQFFDNSTGPATSWAWDFNSDGVADSHAQNPIYTYSNPGNYTVSLTVGGPGGNNSIARSKYVTAIDPVPAVAFDVNRTSGFAPLTVQFSDLSTGIINSWAWDFNGDGVADSTQENPTYTYASPGTYPVNLTISGPYGSRSLTKSGLILVSSAPLFDLSIDYVAALRNVVFAKENNTLAIGVYNDGPDQSLPTVVELRSSDGFVGRAAVPAIDSGDEIEVDIVDPVVRPLAGGTITYTATVDPDDNISELDDTNNAADTITPAVVYNGYKGKRYWEGGSDIVTRRTYDLQGGLAYSQGDSSYHAGGWTNYTITWTGSQPVLPAGAKVVEAYLYASYCWDNTNMIPNNTALSFDGQSISAVSAYTDKSNFGSYANYKYWLVTYNVTSLYRPGSVNTLSVGRLDGNNGANKVATFPFTLMIVYQDGNSTRKQIFINEEYDVLAPSEADYGTNEAEATAYAPFAGMAIDNGSVVNATLYTFATHAGPSEGDLFFNNVTLALGAYHGTAFTSGAELYNVTGIINSTGNVAAIQGTDSGSMGAIQQVLVVEYNASAARVPVANFSANVTSGVAPLAVQFVDGSSNGPARWQWSFGDGSANATVQNPVHTYVSGGNYTVTLTVGNAEGNDTLVRQGFVNCTGSFVVSVSPGWNLVSVPLSNSSLCASDLVDNVSLGVDLIASYSPVSGYLSYYPGAMSGADFALTPDGGYFVHASRSSSFSVYGQPVPAYNVTLYGGWNLVGWTSFTATKASDILSRASVSMVASYSPLSGYLAYYPGAMSDTNFAMLAGMGYFVDSNSTNAQKLYVC